MKHWVILIIASILIVSGCNQQQAKQNTQQAKKTEIKETEIKDQKIQTPDLAGGKEKEVRRPHPLSLADLRKKYPSVFVLNGPSSKRQVALTFDDGPDLEYTPQILDVLKKYNVQATFFVVGNRTKAHPEIVKRMVEEGHEVGSHSYNHPNLPELSPSDFRYQLKQADEILQPLIKYSPKLFRPPYGAIDEEQIKWLASQHYTIVNWNVDSLDWKGLSDDQVADNVLSNVSPGAIILQHSSGGKGEDLSGTVKALPRIIEQLQADDVQFVTVSKLLNIPRNK
jgi:polysaccharide deacetylase family sporulation protein PdaB